MSSSNTDCDGPSYTAPNGLIFEQGCSGGPSSSSFFYYDTKDSAEDCMIWCSQSRPRCYATQYDEEDSTCYVADSLTKLSNETSATYGDLSIVKGGQLDSPTDLDCPYSQYSTQTTSNGMQFQVQCNLDLGGAEATTAPRAWDPRTAHHMRIPLTSAWNIVRQRIHSVRV